MTSLLLKYRVPVMTTTVVLTFGGTYLPQTLGLTKYKSILAQYKDGVEMELEPEMNSFIEKVMYRVNLPVENEAKIKYFPAYGMDSVTKGSSVLNSGAIIGFPVTYTYNKASQIEKDKLQINNEVVDWDTEEGKMLLQSLILSPKAKAFAVAREAFYSYTYAPMVNSFMCGGLMQCAYLTGVWLNTTFHLRHRLKVWGRGAVFGTVALAYGVLYLALNDAYYCYRDNRVDTKAAKLGKEYAEGGVEYYHKILERNKALRYFMGVDGRNYYTPYGNEVSTFRFPHIPHSKRRDNLLYYLKDYEKAEEKCDICEQINPNVENLKRQ